MLRLKVDENLPIEVVALLNDAGHDAMSVIDQGLGGRPDPEVAEICRQEDRVIVTLDLDFADIRIYEPRDFAGIVVLRLTVLDKPRLLSSVKRLILLLVPEALTGKLWIVNESSVRIRE